MEAKLFSHFRNAHHAHILFVGQDQKNGILQFVFWKHFLEFFSGNLNSFFIWWVDDVDESLCVLVVMFPELSDFVLSSDVPDGELDLFELNGLNVESDGWDRGDDLTQFEFIEDGGFTSGIKTEHEGSEFLFAEEISEDFSEVKTHLNEI